MIKRIKIKAYEKGLVFKNDEFTSILGPGAHTLVDPLNRIRVDVVSQRDGWLYHRDLDVIALSGLLGEDAAVLDLADHQRALVWMDDRFDRVLGPGLYALWTSFRKIRYEVIDTDPVQFKHASMTTIAASPDFEKHLNLVQVEQGYQGVLFCDGSFAGLFRPGKYMFWRNTCRIKFHHVDMREKVMDISGQEIMTSDKVTLRLNVVLSYRVEDPLKTISTSEDATQSLYRECQLALRAVVGTCDLDALLSDKDERAGVMEAMIGKRASQFGFSVISLGIRDIILPGDMKDLMNRVIEARKAADANLITRREETAAMRSQANTAKLLENNPTLMRLRELDVLEKISANAKLSVVLGEKGLADRVMNLL